MSGMSDRAYALKDKGDILGAEDAVRPNDPAQVGDRLHGDILRL
jgi:hypothetical protein